MATPQQDEPTARFTAHPAADPSDVRGRRVLFVTWQYHPVPAGGAEHQARLQAEELARRGHRVTVVTRRTAGVPGNTEGVTGDGGVDGVTVRRLPTLDRRMLRTVTFLCSLAVYLVLRGGRHDLVHVHLAGVYTDLVVALAALRRRPVYLKVAAGGESGEVHRLRRIARITRYWGLRHAARVQALSPQIAQELRDVGVREERLLRLPNGVEAHNATDDLARAKARRALGLPEGGPLVLYLGRFSRYKGVADLVDAWGMLPETRRQEARLLLVGYRPDRPPEEQLDLTPAHQTVLVHRWTDRAADYLRAADIFVLPSYSEGMSNALLEAMARGLPCVATRVGAAEEMMVDGDSGLLVPPGVPSALAAALGRLLEDEDGRRRMGAAAAATIEREYSIAAVVTRLEAAYDVMLAEHPGPR